MVTQRQNLIEAWDDRQVGAGEDFARVIAREIETADTILLLVVEHYV